MKERLVIVVIAIVLGLALTTVGFFIYQSTKIVPDEKIAGETQTDVTPTPDESFFITIDEPSDETVVDRRSIDVKGTTNPENVIVVTSNQEDVVARPTRDGKFSIKLAIDAGTNLLITRIIGPDGREKIDERIVTFSTEDF